MFNELKIEQQSQSSDYGSHNIEKNSHNKHIDQEKIQRFYQSCQRLKKFADNTKNLSLQQNDDLFKYLSKFHKPQNQRKNDTLPNRDIINLVQQRIQRMIKSQKPKKNWTLDDRTILDWVVVHFALHKNYKNIEKEFTKDDWNFVASLIPGATVNSCMFKWLSLHKTNLNEANWSEDESQLLKTLVARYVNSNKSIRWKDVCKKLYLQNQNVGKNYRTQKQCKQHWVCKLNPNIKRQPWTQEEDILLLQTIKQNSGLKKWVQMVKLFKGRTQNAVKNRFNLIIQKQRKCIQKQKDQLQLIEAYLQRCYVEKFTKILEPDSQERNDEEEKIQKQRTKKTKKIKKKENEVFFNFQYSQISTNGKCQMNSLETESSSFIKIEKISLVEIVHPQNEVVRPIQQFISIENLSDIDRYNHRANDIDFDFMHLDSILH